MGRRPHQHGPRRPTRRAWNVDTGFIVLNDRNYSTFSAMLRGLGVAVQDTHMGFSVSADGEDFEYAGTPRGLLCQPRNVSRPAFVRMVADLLRFNREMRALLASGKDGRSLSEYLERAGYSRWFVERLIVPQASADRAPDPPVRAGHQAGATVKIHRRPGTLAQMGETASEALARQAAGVLAGGASGRLSARA